MAKKTIDELTSLSEVASGDELAVYDVSDNKTKKATAADVVKAGATGSVASGNTNGVNGGTVYTAIENAIEALDVSSAGGSGKFIQAISETNGKISATEGTIDSAPTSGSGNPVSSGGVYDFVTKNIISFTIPAGKELFIQMNAWTSARAGINVQGRGNFMLVITATATSYVMIESVDSNNFVKRERVTQIVGFPSTSTIDFVGGYQTIRIQNNTTENESFWAFGTFVAANIQDITRSLPEETRGGEEEEQR